VLHGPLPPFSLGNLYLTALVSPLVLLNRLGINTVSLDCRIPWVCLKSDSFNLKRRLALFWIRDTPPFPHYNPAQLPFYLLFFAYEQRVAKPSSSAFLR